MQLLNIFFVTITLFFGSIFASQIHQLLGLLSFLAYVIINYRSRFSFTIPFISISYFVLVHIAHNLYYDDFKINQLSSILFNFLFFISFFFIASFDIHKRTLNKSAYMILLLTSLLLMAQVILYKLTGSYLDIANILQTGESRYEDYACISNCSIRYSGYQIEPSQLSSSIAAFYLLLDKDYRGKTSVILITIFSLLMTGSTLAYFQAALVALNSFKLNLRYISLYALVGILYISFFFDLNEFLIKVFSSGSIRLNLFMFIFTQDLYTILFGNGVIHINPELEYIINTTESHRIATLNDLGISITIIYFLGLFFLIPIFLLLLTRKNSIIIIFLYMTLKFSINHLIFYIVLIKLLKK